MSERVGTKSPPIDLNELPQGELSFGKLFEAYRNKRGLTVGQVAALDKLRGKITRERIYNIEAEDGGPMLETALDLARAIDIPMSEFERIDKFPKRKVKEPLPEIDDEEGPSGVSQW